MGPILGRQDPGGPHVGFMNFAFCEKLVVSLLLNSDEDLQKNGDGVLGDAVT